MNFNDSRLANLLRLFRSRGPHYGMSRVAATLTKKYFGLPLTVFPDFERVLDAERPACLSAPQSGSLEINWILPGIGPASGGLLNIFRTIQQLEAWGHKNRVYTLARLPRGSTPAKELVRKWYFPVNAEVEVLSDNIKDSSALIATSWPTAYAVR